MLPVHTFDCGPLRQAHGLQKTHSRLYGRALAVPTILAGLLLPFVLVGTRLPLPSDGLLLLYGTVMLPPLVGLVATGLLLGDPNREVLLAAPYPVWRVVLQRLGLVLSAAWVPWAGLLLAAWLAGKQSLVGGLLLFSSGMAAYVGCAGLGVWAALWVRSQRSAALLVAGVWAVVLMLSQSYGQLPLVGLSGIGLVCLLASVHRMRDEEGLVLMVDENLP